MNATQSIIPSPAGVRPEMSKDAASVPGTIRCIEVSFRYFPQQPLVIRSFSHHFRPGITLIKGASGCGKSTLLRLMAGYLAPCSGFVVGPRGRPPTDAEFQRHDIGYVFQQLNLLPLASITRNLELA